MKRRLVWGAALLVVAGGVLAYRMINRKDAAPAYETVRVKRGDVRAMILATGVVQPQNRVEVKPPIAGRAERILAREGDAVRRGQVLAWMSSVERAALLDAARAQGAEELAYWETLYKPAPLVSPLTGVVIARRVEPGQSITPQDAVLVVSNRLIVKAQVDETDIGRIQVGQEAEFSLDAYPEEALTARVDHIAYEATMVSNVIVYEVDVVAEAVPPFMRSGMTANVNFCVDERLDVLTLPSAAVTAAGRGAAGVLLPADPSGGSPREAKIKTGLSDGRTVEVLAGLSENDPVLMPTFRLPASSRDDRTSPFTPGRRRGR